MGKVKIDKTLYLRNRYLHFKFGELELEKKELYLIERKNRDGGN